MRQRLPRLDNRPQAIFRPPVTSWRWARSAPFARRGSAPEDVARSSALVDVPFPLLLSSKCYHHLPTHHVTRHTAATALL